ncbi:gas vesicle protein GvpN [Halobacillus sp. A1]|uniref:gas vesicle protein GvpN n=1 Tax=Halobacillus sp. A1 TaxID=2880262 RepID=UPI0020A6B3E0|nr:gas vesicle protein GvpN [Halobacillus sp. A1]MCP3032214.1 gas vesicle protein GvpN [Halobacillus sp. A1]
MTTLKDSTNNQIQQDVYNDPYFKSLIQRSLRYLKTGYPVHFTGPSGIGKTTLALHIAKQRQRPVLLINGNKELSNEDLIGAYTGYRRKKLNDNFVRTVHKIEENISEEWVQGRLYEAVKEGYTVVYDEFTRSQPETNNLFLSILEEKILPLYGTKRTASYIDVHPDFSIMFTSNPAEYAGVYQSQDALLDRMVTLPVEYMDEEAEIAIVIQKTKISKYKARAIVQFVNRVRELCDNDIASLSLRSSLMIAQVVEKYDIKVDGNDEEFQDLCMDITLFPLRSCSDDSESIDDLRDKILAECREV